MARHIVRCLSGTTREQRWKYLSTAKLKSRARQSGGVILNLAFDLLADALANASGKPYTQLFEEQITRPLGMKDTTTTPSPDQCRLPVDDPGARCQSVQQHAGGNWQRRRSFHAWRYDALDAAVFVI
ncbi:serine hydrolase [Escherichia coli]|nr:serine hydrolase [Escherichia coli]